MVALSFRRFTLAFGNGVVLDSFGWPILPPRARATSFSIEISEFRTRGPDRGNDEFIELYNLSALAANIGGWLVKGSNNYQLRNGSQCPLSLSSDRFLCIIPAPHSVLYKVDGPKTGFPETIPSNQSALRR